MKYTVMNAEQLSETDIKTILRAWSILEWKNLTSEQFKTKFKKSAFHFLYEKDTVVALLRVNDEFFFRNKDIVYNIPELVGLISLVPGKGFGKELLARLKESLLEEDRECLGFCFENNRGFYEKCGFEVFEGKAKYFLEQDKGKWVSSEDDDVLNINLKPSTIQVIKALSLENFAFSGDVETVSQICSL